jgi:hypothetical protein
MTSTTLCYVMPYRWVEVHRRSSVTSMIFYSSVRRHVIDDNSPYIRRCENLKSKIFFFVDYLMTTLLA